MLVFICDKVVLYILPRYLRCSMDLVIFDRSVAMSLYDFFDTVGFGDTHELCNETLYILRSMSSEPGVFV